MNLWHRLRRAPFIARATRPGSKTFSAVSVTTTATLLLAANTNRRVALISNNSAAVVFLGGTSGVTTASGTPLPANSALTDTLPSTDAWYGIVASGTADVRVLEIV